MLFKICGKVDCVSHNLLKAKFKERVYRILSVAFSVIEGPPPSVFSRRPQGACNGTHGRSGCTPAEPYPPMSNFIVLLGAAERYRLLRFGGAKAVFIQPLPFTLTDHVSINSATALDLNRRAHVWIGSRCGFASHPATKSRRASASALHPLSTPAATTTKQWTAQPSPPRKTTPSARRPSPCAPMGRSTGW